MPAFTETSLIQASPGQISCDLHGEAVILGCPSEKYYGVDPVGALVWNYVQQPRRLADIEQAIRAEYAVDADTCRRDLLAFLNRLAAEGLIEVNGEEAA